MLRSYDDDAVRLVRRSTELEQPLIYVSMNYRSVSNAFFFVSSI